MAGRLPRQVLIEKEDEVEARVRVATASSTSLVSPSRRATIRGSVSSWGAVDLGDMDMGAWDEK